MSQRKAKHKLVLVLVLFAMILLCGCGMAPFYSPVMEENEMDEEENLIVVGISQLGSESVWRSANTLSIQNAISKENGYFPIFNNARQKQENQIKAIRGFISQRVDYIVFAPLVEDGWDTILQEAKDAGIPVILMDRTISAKDDSLYVTRVGTDARKEGENAGYGLETELAKTHRDDEEINIVVLQGTLGSSVQRGRTAGFDSVVREHENWRILEQVDADFTTSKGKEIMEQMLKKYQDIDVVVSQNDDMTFGAIEAIKEAGLTTGIGGDIIIISTDAVYDALQMVKDGMINVDVECNPEQGEAVLEVIRKLERGETVEKEYIVEEKVFTIDNVEQYLDTRTY